MDDAGKECEARAMSTELNTPPAETPARTTGILPYQAIRDMVQNGEIKSVGILRGSIPTSFSPPASTCGWAISPTRSTRAFCPAGARKSSTRCVNWTPTSRGSKSTCARSGPREGPRLSRPAGGIDRAQKRSCRLRQPEELDRPARYPDAPDRRRGHPLRPGGKRLRRTALHRNRTTQFQRGRAHRNSPQSTQIPPQRGDRPARDQQG